MSNRFSAAMRLVAVAACAALTLPFQAAAETSPRLQVYGVLNTLEIAPILLAAERHYPAGADLNMGGIASLFPDDPNLPRPHGAVPGKADVASHAETQALRNSLRHPELRIVLTVSEGLYRIVARGASGVTEVADLKGKTIAYVPGTSSAFYLHKMLRTAGLTEADVVLIPFRDAQLSNPDIDAVVIWEPEGQHAIEAFGKDAVEIYVPGVYRERYNLNTTATALADPAMRQRIVGFVGAILEAACDINMEPSAAWALSAARGDRSVREVAQSWGRQTYPAYLPPNLLDVLVDEEAWLAGLEKRPARTRAELAPLIDTSVLEEAMAAREPPSVARRC